MGMVAIDTKYVQDKITQLRLSRGISEYKLSLDLGQNRSYIQSICSGRSLPSMSGFLNICDYFDITPSQFFNDYGKESDLSYFIGLYNELNKEDREIIIKLMEKLI